MAHRIAKLLNDAVLGFFALVSLFLMIAPAVFTLAPSAQATLAFAEYGIIALFAIEYGAGFALAPQKWPFVKNRWRIIDAIIIVAAIVPLFPAGPEFLRNSPALRLLRLGRVALLGTRSSLALKSIGDTLPTPTTGAVSELRVLALGAAGATFEALPWEAGLARVGSSTPDWLFISGVTEDRLAPIAAALAVPEKAFSGLFHSNIPRFDRLERFSTLFVRYPLPLQANAKLLRTPVLLVGSAENVVVLSRESTDLEARVELRLADLDPKMPRMVRAAVALLGAIISANTEVVERLESTLFRLESEQATLKDEQFLARTFELRADILRIRSSLKHLKFVIRDLSRGDLSFGAQDIRDRELFQLLEEDTSDLYEGVEDLRDSLQALVDIRLNVASFQMNRVMRLLALLTALALIPATAGGLLGMNVGGTPWPTTLSQVAFGVAAGMALSLYFFMIKGWLRS